MSSSPRGRVLLADDDDDIRETLAMALADQGWQTVEARDGNEALSRAASEQFDALILDHRMPGLLGGEVHQKLRERGSSTPVILITAANRIRELATTFGVKDFLGKPFSLDDLYTTLDRVAAPKGGVAR